MRETESIQFEVGATPISEIEISVKSRDNIPALLEAEVNPKARKDTYRPCMELWRNLALAIYTNWPVGNGFVIAVGFDHPQADATAKTRIQSYFPDRDINMIGMLESWPASGGVHCHTNDHPADSLYSSKSPNSVRASTSTGQ